jgi:hypothetical protein
VSRLRILCGLLAIGVCVSSLQASAARSRTTVCSTRLVQLGPVFGSGCWHRTGARYRASTPVTLDGLKLSGSATITLDEHAGTFTSSKPVRWIIGAVQFRRTPFRWKVKSPPLRFNAAGAVRGMKFTGAATLSFNGSDGGTTKLATKLAIPGLSGGVSGDALLTVSRRHGFDVRKVHVAVGQLGIGRLLFKQLNFSYTNGTWTASAGVRLPAFTGSTPTLAGTVQVGNGPPRISVSGSGLTIPLGEGFTLTKAGLDLGLGPLVIQGTATATYGPPIAGHGPLQIDGGLNYSSQPERWEATGTVSFPWGIPGVNPSASVGLELLPGRAILFNSKADLSVHGIGLTGELNGFAAPRGFNAEGDADLKAVLFKLHGTALVSSKGMSACGSVSFLFFKKKLGFGYTWGGALGMMGSSCDVGRFRVPLLLQAAQVSGPTLIDLASPAGFAVFAARGGDFTVTTPGPAPVTYSSTPDRDAFDSFAYHDPVDNVSYLAIPTSTVEAEYTVTPVAGATLSTVTVANGLQTHAGTSDLTGSVSGSGRNLTLNYTIDTSQFQTGETVSFFQGQSGTVAGGEPIIEDIQAADVPPISGSAPFTPEPLGSTDRSVFAVVSIDGRPREQIFIAAFTAFPVLPPSAAVFIQSSAGGWTVSLLKPQRVVTWQVQTTADDGRDDYEEVAGTTASIAITAGTATHATISVTPVDQFGRTGPTYICDTAKQGSCPAS